MRKNDFPLLVRNPNLSYLDSGATSQKPQVVIDRVAKFYLEENANPHRGIYELAEKATNEYENAREVIAKFIGAKTSKSIAFTSGTSMGTNVIAYAWARENINPGEGILSTIMEHHANLVPWQSMAQSKLGVNLQLVGMSDDGVLDLNDMEDKLKSGNGKIRLVCVSHVSNVLGTLNPIKEIATLAHRYGAVILADGAQAMGHLSVNVTDLGVDFYVFSGHKMLGPMGSGAVYVHPDRFSEMGIMFGGGDMISRVTPDEAFFRPMPYRLEAGTQCVADQVGLATAMNYLDSLPCGMKSVEEYIHELGNYAWSELSKIPHIKLLGPGPGQNWSASLISFTLSHKDAPNSSAIDDSFLAEELGINEIAVRNGLFCAQPLVEFRLGLKSAVRASFHIYNDKGDIDNLVKKIKKIQNS